MSLDGSEFTKWVRSAISSIGEWVFGGDIQLKGNKLKTTDHIIKQGGTTELYLMLSDDITYSNFRLGYIDLHTGLYMGGDALSIFGPNTDDTHFKLQARDNGVGRIEVARLQGAADPYFQATLPMRLLPVATAALPGTPVEGMLAYDGTTKKLKVWTGAAWETVTSA